MNVIKMRCIKEVYGFNKGTIYFFDTYLNEISYKGMIIIPIDIQEIYFEKVD